MLSSADVASFEPYRAHYADALKDGDLAPAFAVFDRFRARADARMRAATALLDDTAVLRGRRSGRCARRRGSGCQPTALEARWRQRVRGELLALTLAGSAPDAARATLRKRYQQLAARTDALTSDDVFQRYVDAYMRSLDPHSEYFLPHRARRANAAAPLEGIGVQLKTDREYVAIRQIFDGGAADRSGRLHAGDRIVAVGEGDGGEAVDVVGWTLDPVVDLIRGAAGSTVRLAVLPQGAGTQHAPVQIDLVRDRIALHAQGPRKSCTRIADLRLCTITVPRFYIDYAAAGRGGADYPGTAADVARLLNAEREQPPDGIVLDLRGNGGGALLEAARLAGLFIDIGPVVQVKHADGNIEQFPDPIPGALYTGPLYVLVDRYSASATEIFAAAIRDYGRGAILGEHSYGKGTVQETVDLNEAEPEPGTFGQLVLTTAEYFRVTGKSTQLAGVDLDLELPAWPGAGDYGERFESHPLPPGQVQAVDLHRVARRRAGRGCCARRARAAAAGRYRAARRDDRRGATRAAGCRVAVAGRTHAAGRAGTQRAGRRGAGARLAHGRRLGAA